MCASGFVGENLGTFCNPPQTCYFHAEAVKSQRALSISLFFCAGDFKACAKVTVSYDGGSLQPWHWLRRVPADPWATSYEWDLNFNCAISLRLCGLYVTTATATLPWLIYSSATYKIQCACVLFHPSTHSIPLIRFPKYKVEVVAVQPLSLVQLFVTPWTAFSARPCETALTSSAQCKMSLTSSAQSILSR